MGAVSYTKLACLQPDSCNSRKINRTKLLVMEKNNESL